jgi:hypothetical protein
VALFARDKLAVCAPILAAARLQQAQWQQIIHEADAETTQFIRALHPDNGAAPQPPLPPPPARNDKTPPVPSATPSIEEVISRIEALRAARAAPALPEPEPLPRIRSEPEREPEPAAESPSEPEPQSSSLFRWECGPSGELEWVEGAPRAALIGMPLVDRGREREGGEREVDRAFAVRAPFSNARVSLGEENALAGEWELSGLPAFDHSTGRFAGYRGVAKRASASPATKPAIPVTSPESLRELVHEIKTPLNAVMGFAEIIQRQMFGPAGATYRKRAEEIVAQAQLLLDAIEDLDQAARSRSSPSPPTDLAEVIERITPAIRERAAPREVTIEVARSPSGLAAAVDASLAERLILRLCNGLVDRAGRGERLRLLLDRIEDQCRVSIGRPVALQGLTEQALFGRESTTPADPGLRLVRGLAEIGGVGFTTTADSLSLNFPSSPLGDPGLHGYGAPSGRGL